MIIRMQDIWLNQIKKMMLYPREDELILNDDDLKELCVFPALIEYFNKFPLKNYQQLTHSGEGVVTIPFPDDETFGILDVRMTEKNFTSETTRSDDLWNLILYQRSTTMKTMGRYGRTQRLGRKASFNPEGLRNSYILDRQKANALNELETVKYILDEENMNLQVHSTMPGMIAITWAKFSRDFDNHVRHTQKLNVTKLATAHAMEYIAGLDEIIEDSNKEKSFNVAALNDKAEKLRTQVYDVWNEIPTIFIQRGA